MEVEKLGGKSGWSRGQTTQRLWKRGWVVRWLQYQATHGAKLGDLEAALPSDLGN